MIRQAKRASDNGPIATVYRPALIAVVVLCASLCGAGIARADRDSPDFHRGACQGAYPGWLRGVVDGYNGLASSPVTDATSILVKVPNPEALSSADEKLGYGDGLMVGFKLGVDYGVELGRAARTPKSNTQTMNRSAEALLAYISFHCGDLIAALDWAKTPMNQAGASTIASFNEAQIIMSLAASANQIAISTEDLARCAREAEAKGDQAAALKCRAGAKSSAQIAAGFADMARSHAAAGLEEATQAVMDAQSAADRAKKSADDTGG